MKHSTLAFIFLASCSSPQISALSDLAISYGQASGRLSPEKAELAREASVILLPPVEVTASK